MGFRELEYVRALAEYRSITKAAKAVGLTQPAMSMFLRNLEGQLGAPLFERVGKGLILTYAGERYLHYANEILLTEQEMRTELSEFGSEGHGCLTLACMLPRSTYLVPMTIPAFKEHCPEVGIQLYEEIAYSDIEKDLLEGRAFLGIGNWQSKDPRLSAEVLREEELLLAVDENHVVAKSLGGKPGDPPMAVDYQNFKDDPVIVPKGTTTAGLQQEFSRAYNPSQPIFLETRNIENALRLAAEGFGLTFLCDTHINFQYLPKNLVFFSVGIPKMTLYLLRRANSYTPSYVHTYIDILRQYY